MNPENEAAAVPCASVGADAGQPLSQKPELSIAEENAECNEPTRNFADMQKLMRRLNDSAYLPTVSMNDLYENVYQSSPPIVDGLLCAGTYLLAGAPKVGKSFLVAQLAYHVSTGLKLWDYEVRKGTVLYLALEDNYQRLQERMFRMFGVEGTDDLHFAVYAKQIGNGLDEQLEKFLREHPNTNLVIIDTLQKVREVGDDAYSYANDYEIVGKFKQFADKHNICLLLVHHTRKQPAGDKFEMISGTTGLLGCADGAFLLQKENRTDLSATLDIVGRDQADQRLYLTRDQEHLCWNLDHAEAELWKAPTDPLLDAVAGMLTEDTPEWQGSATELIDKLHLEIQPNVLAKKLNVLAGQLFQAFHVKYENSHGRSGSRIKLMLADKEA
ncbi:MAG: helicase RepA family protein [Oscillospiraceae bacterium]|nr:helicase RepA family protein [Oscillospiraceae bacterium]